jgi:serine/threonine protein kinase
MGCGGSKTSEHFPDLDWAGHYEKSASQAEVQRRLSEKSLAAGAGKGRALVETKGKQVTAINGYSVAKSLGKGAFGEVYLASCGADRYAIKVLHKSALQKMKQGKNRTALDSVKAEIATMKKIAHPNCVLMFDVILDDSRDEVFLVLEYVDGGTSQPTGKDGKPVPLAAATIWSHLRHLVMGLEYLHMNGIIHRDIKPENLLLTRPGQMYKGSPSILKIADFGTAALCAGDSSAQRTAGTPPFFSPELCASGSDYDVRVVDLWAVGVTIYQWVSGRVPFEAETVFLLMQAISGAEAVTPAPPEAPAGLKEVVEGLLTRDPATRLTLTQLRLHPWLTDGGKQPLPRQPVMKVEVRRCIHATARARHRACLHAARLLDLTLQPPHVCCRCRSRLRR